MDKPLAENLEALLNEKDPDKIKELREKINLSTASDSAEIMQRVNMFLDTRDDDSRQGLERIIKELKQE